MDNKNIFTKTQLIELRQNNNNATNANVNKDVNGDYKVALSNPILIEEGDEIGIHSVFLDTSSTNDGLINLEPTTNDPSVPANHTRISASFGYYLTNVPTANEGPARIKTGADIVSKQYTNPGAGPSEDTGGRIDGELYVACSRHIVSGGAGRVCSGFSMQMTAPALNKFNPTSFTFLDIRITYKQDQSGKSMESEIAIDIAALQKFPSLRSALVRNNRFTIDGEFMKQIANTPGSDGAIRVSNFPFLFDNNTNIAITRFNGSGRSENHDFAVVDPSFIIEDQSKTTIAAETRHPIINSVFVDVPSGKYTASQVTAIIGQGFTNVNMNGAIGAESYDIDANPIVTTSANLIKEVRALKGAGQDDTIEFVRTDGTKSFQLKTSLEADNTLTPGAPNYLIGSSQFSLIYNDIASKMELDRIHNSLLSLEDPKGQSQIRAYKNTGGEKFVVNKYSGIYLTDLQPRSLWQDQFKFNYNDIVVDIHNSNSLTIEGQLINVPTFLDTNPTPNALVDGRNITGDNLGTDSLVVKVGQIDAGTNQFTSSYDTPNPFVDYPDFVGTNETDLITIQSQGIVNSGGLAGAEAEGYYQIELDLGIDQDIQGKDIKNNKIQAIVSRYYSQGSYTSAYNEGQISYIHKGSPLYINDIGIRILQPDNSVATDINENNSVFLQITKTK